ncbi:MAG: hypothetical protein IPL73_21510 [Candidatus Obscuribacter sp.]|jgi:hypothetical protein|nr:hypothetical protein [Candidatus Obscuribacter sp.]
MTQVLDRAEAQPAVEQVKHNDAVQPQTEALSPLDAARFDDTKIAAGKDTSNLHPIGFEDSAKADHNLSVKDFEKPENSGKSMREFLEQNGMPADNKDGKRDQFLGKFIDNTGAKALKEQGYLKTDSPTQEELGKALEDVSFDESLRVMNGPDGMKDELNMPKDASPEEMRKLFTPKFFEQIVGPDAKVGDYAAVADSIRQSNLKSFKQHFGITD